MSYYDPSLEPDVPYTFTVVAIDSAGQRSSVATATLGGGTTAPPSSGDPGSPENLRASVYSRRSAELFWERAPAALRVRYEIRRDGQPLETTDGVSYYTNALEPGREYAFEVVAIDRQGNRSAPSSVTVRTAGEGSTNPLPSDAPAAPANLRASVYSRQAAELFWERAPATLGLRYEIRRDGQVVRTTDGVSYFTGDLEGGRDYAFEVIAIDREGVRSSPAQLTVRTTGDGPSIPPPTESPSAPEDVRIEIYSGTAAELFWTRPPAADRVVSTEIRRDGQLLTTKPGNSFFDDGRVRGQAYRYELTAISASGARSSTTIFEEGGTTAPDPEPSLPAAVSERLDTLFAVANGDAFEPMIAVLERLGTRDQDAERTPISSAPDPDFPRAGPREVFACPDGGTFAVAAGSVSGSGPFYSTVAEGCAIGELTVDGTFYEDSTINRTGGPSSLGLRVQDYRLVDAAAGTTMTMSSGEVGFREPAAQDGGEYAPVRWIARELTVAGGGESYTAANQVTTWPESVSPDATVTFGLEVSIEGLDGGGYADAMFETVTPLRPTEAGAERFASGTVRVVDGGGRVETLDADGGDREAFVLTLEEGGVTTSYAVPWSEVEGFVRLEPDEATRP